MTLTRFAPAPTGYLHLGHVANAIYVWGLARVRGGRVLLRIEDHDAERSRPEYERALVDDLDWLGFVPDLYPTSAFRAASCPSRQSERRDLYADVAMRLAAAGLVYGCACTRQDVVRASPPVEPGGERRYPGTCRARHLPLSDRVAWRIRLEPGVETFDDLLLGPQSQDPAAYCGDVVIRDRLGNWTYQFAVSVDDFLQDVTLVVRGTDLLTSTARQIRLARLIGRPSPAAFAHHPLIMQSARQKLSKADRAAGIRDLRDAGWTPARVTGEAARRVGLKASRELPASAVGECFAYFAGPGTTF